ncbi:MAG: oxidoreductase molybdopterin binding protein, partial [Dehalococcoidia bacterium]|nr:oxidoreductase molybdopterin binding protein [Dehalococcoidia bacterium]
SDPAAADSDVTPEEQFYVVSKNFGDPEVEAAGWRLQVEGQVERPLSLSLDEIKGLSATRQYTTLECISNEIGGNLISNALWTGIPVAEIIRQAGAKPEAGYFMTYAADGYTETMPLSEAMRDEVLLVYELNGKPLSRKHGFPLRLIYPGHYGMKMTKWITKIELTKVNQPGYWSERGWDETATVLTMSKINYPERGSDVPAGDIAVRGVAFAGDRGISKVELSVDDQETWAEAELKPSLSQYSWSLWTWTWRNPEMGFQRIWVRAVDGEGTLQDKQESPTFPIGATGYASVLVRVV